MELDARARLRRYLSAFRRRWYLVALPLVVGVAVGWATAPQEVTVNDLGVPIPRTTYYQAAHVLIQEESQTGLDPNAEAPLVNLSQAAYLTNTGEVPKRVADELGIDVGEVEDSVIGLPLVQVASIEVKAVGTDPQRVVDLADTAANHLLVVLQSEAEAEAAEAEDEVVVRLEELDGELSQLNAEIAADPPNRIQLEAQQRSLQNQYTLAYEQLTALANRPSPTAGLTSLETAKADEISEEEYDSVRKTIREGADYVTGVATTTTDVGSGSGEASPASRPVRAAIGGLVGLAAGIGLVLLLDRFDARLRRRDDVEAVTGLTVVAEIPPLARRQQRSLEVVAVEHPRSRSAEAYRVVRGAVMFGVGTERAREDGALVLMVTSPNPGEGKTTTVANLAAVLAEGGFAVLVVNCDFRRPRVHAYLLDEDQQRDEERKRMGSVRSRPTAIPGVSLVAGLGEADDEVNPLEVVALQRKVIDRARPHVDVVLLDTAPFLATNDASELLALTDQVLLVVRAGKTTAEAAHRTAEVLERFQAPVLGVVFNDSAESHAAQYYYGYSESGTRSRDRRGDSASDAASRRANGTSPERQADQAPGTEVLSERSWP